ncbi:MAG TPA: hypothetical protein VF146_11105 [Bryobacteraceae bacterium]
MKLRLTILSLAVALLSYGDTLTLRNGRVVHGDYIGGDARHIRFTVGDRVDTYSVEDVDTVQFGRSQEKRSEAAPSTGFAPEPAPSRSFDRDRDRDQRPPVQAYASQIPVGTQITVRMIDAVNSEETRLGQTFRASIDEPVMVGDQTVVQRGADAVVKLVQDQKSGKFEGRTVLTLVLQQVMVNGRMVDLTTGDVSEASNSRGSRTAKVVGGTTALGAIVGAIAGGGKGAAIGAASGAAVGGTAQAVTKGQVVKIPSETRLTFTLQQPAQL